MEKQPALCRSVFSIRGWVSSKVRLPILSFLFLICSNKGLALILATLMKRSCAMHESCLALGGLPGGCLFRDHILAMMSLGSMVWRFLGDPKKASVFFLVVVVNQPQKGQRKTSHRLRAAARQFLRCHAPAVAIAWRALATGGGMFFDGFCFREPVFVAFEGQPTAKAHFLWGEFRCLGLPTCAKLLLFCQKLCLLAIIFACRQFSVFAHSSINPNCKTA